MPKYRYVGEVATQVSVGDKRVPLAPGDFINLSDNDLKHEDNEVVKNNLLTVSPEKAKGGESG